uniref:Uncharacterized protein n=1 Tax=Chenopodium quinoa TaxID=63459 RepID=A0A803MK04_CHEQI
MIRKQLETQDHVTQDSPRVHHANTDDGSWQFMGGWPVAIPSGDNSLKANPRAGYIAYSSSGAFEFPPTPEDEGDSGSNDISSLVSDSVVPMKRKGNSGSPSQVSSEGSVTSRIGSQILDEGDFNQVEYLSDKLKERFTIPGQLDFIQWRTGLDLVGVPFTGPEYTWTNNKSDSNPIFERLDRAYATSSWFSSYPDTKVLHQPILFLDHAAIILSDSPDSRYEKRPYRVENWCLSALKVRDFVHSAFSLFFPWFSNVLFVS